MAQVSDDFEHGLTVDPVAVTAWQAGLDGALTFDHSGIGQLETAVTLDPQFALGHAMLGRQKLIHGDWPAGLAALDQAMTLAIGATERERSLIALLHGAAHGRANTLASALVHVETWPTDIIAFSLVIGPFGLHAFSGRTDWRQTNVAMMAKYRSLWPQDHWWYLANEAFTEVEGGLIRQGRARAEKAWQVRQTGTAAHSMSHAHIEDNAQDEGLAFVDMWLAGPGVGSDMRHHIHWHKSIFEFDMGRSNADHASHHFATSLSAAVSDPMPLSTFSDNASFLWRAKLRDYVTPAPYIAETLAYMDRHYPNGGFVFADVHRICAAALTEDKRRMQQLLAEFRLRDTERNTATSRYMAVLCDGFFALAEGRAAKAVDLLGPVLDQECLLGGSNPQRRIVRETFDAARNKAAFQTPSTLGDPTQ